MRTLKILFCLLGDRNKASSRVRGYWLTDELEKRGIQCTIVVGDNRKSLLHCLAILPRHNVIFFQKNASRWHVWLMDIANLLGKITLFDLDDAPSRVNSSVTLKNAGKMMSRASAVLAGSQKLLEYASKYNTNTYLLPTSVKLENYIPAEKHDLIKPLCLGWIGNGAHYYRDLIEVLREPLKEISLKHKIRFKIVGACGKNEIYTSFTSIPNLETEIIDRINWADPIAVSNAMQDFDIGLYPLLDNEFNKYKCGFKALEYMAMGIPVVSSSVAINKDIIKNGVDGYFADRPKEWINKLIKLITNPNKRYMMGRCGREKVKNNYNISLAAKKLLNVIEQDILKDQ